MKKPCKTVLKGHAEIHGKNLYTYLVGGFKYVLCSPLFGEDSHFDKNFSNGLKPPTSYESWTLTTSGFGILRESIQFCRFLRSDQGWWLREHQMARFGFGNARIRLERFLRTTWPTDRFLTHTQPNKTSRNSTQLSVVVMASTKYHFLVVTIMSIPFIIPI